MKAARIYEYGPPDVFSVEEAPEPVCGKKDLLLEVHAAAVNPVDAKMRRGGLRGVARLKLPWILGLDVSGVVLEVGSQVTGFSVGDEVYSSPSHRRPGCYAQRVALPAAWIAKKPSNITHEEAAGIPLTTLTAWAALVDRGVSSGDKILVQAGAGGVGTMAIQLAKHLGAYVATTCSAGNAELVESLGADLVIDYRTTDFVELLSDYDGVVDALGKEERFRARKILKRGGFIACLNAGFPEATKKYGPYLGAAVALTDNAAFIAGSFFRGVRVTNVLRAVDGGILAKITELVESGALRPVVDRVFPLEEIAAAHAYSETGRARGKIIISVQDP